MRADLSHPSVTLLDSSPAKLHVFSRLHYCSIYFDPHIDFIIIFGFSYYLNGTPVAWKSKCISVKESNLFLKNTKVRHSSSRARQLPLRRLGEFPCQSWQLIRSAAHLGKIFQDKISLPKSYIWKSPKIAALPFELLREKRLLNIRKIMDLGLKQIWVHILASPDVCLRYSAWLITFSEAW